METDLDTYLSPHVYNLYVNLCENTERDCKRIFLHENLTIDWSAISSILDNPTEDFRILEQPVSWYETTLKSMWPIFHSINRTFEANYHLNQNGFQTLLDWTDSSIEITRYYSEYQETNKKSNEETFKLVLFFTSILERSLGNIFFAMNTNVPFLLRDLLNTHELKSILGITTVTFIQLIVGTPRGLNLRNVAWHGFIEPSEIDGTLITILIVLIASIGAIVQNQGTMVSLSHRNYFALSKFDLTFEEEAKNDLFTLEHLFKVINRTRIVPPATKSLWIYALTLIKNTRFGEGCMVLLPLSEHLLRCVFCLVNGCSSRLLTAEADTLYTILDQILSPDFICENELVKKNKLYEALPIESITMLNDLFSYPFGPRLRDKFSHGEIKLGEVSVHLSNFFVHILTDILLQLNSYFQYADIDENFVSEDLLLKTRFLKHSVYYPKFHLLSVVRTSLSKAVQGVYDLDLLPKPKADPFSSAKIQVSNEEPLEDHLSSFVQFVDSCYLSDFKDPNEFKLFAKFVQFKVTSDHCCAFQNREFSTYLMQMANKITDINDNIRKSLLEKYSQWSEFKLRERGRISYLRILQLMPTVRLLLISILYLLILNFMAVALNQQTPSSLSDLKLIYSAIQNCYSYTQASVNRWLEIVTIAKRVVPVLEKIMLKEISPPQLI